MPTSSPAHELRQRSLPLSRMIRPPSRQATAHWYVCSQRAASLASCWLHCGPHRTTGRGRCGTPLLGCWSSAIPWSPLHMVGMDRTLRRVWWRNACLAAAVRRAGQGSKLPWCAGAAKCHVPVPNCQLGIHVLLHLPRVVDPPLAHHSSGR